MSVKCFLMLESDLDPRDPQGSRHGGWHDDDGDGDI